MKCPVCNIEDAIIDTLYGVMVGLICKTRRENLKSPDTQIEFTSTSIKTERKQYAKDILQPYRGNEPSKEFIDAYPSKAKEMFTPKEIKQARNVWK